MSLIDPTWFERLTLRQQVLTLVGILIATILAVSLLVWLFTGEKSGKEDKLESNIDQKKGVNAVIGNLVTNQQTEVNNAAKNTNTAIRDLANSNARDSSTFNGSRANARFCARFPDDSSCRQH